MFYIQTIRARKVAQARSAFFKKALAAGRALRNAQRREIADAPEIKGYRVTTDIELGGVQRTAWVLRPNGFGGTLWVPVFGCRLGATMVDWINKNPVEKI